MRSSNETRRSTRLQDLAGAVTSQPESQQRRKQPMRTRRLGQDVDSLEEHSDDKEGSESYEGSVNLLVTQPRRSSRINAKPAGATGLRIAHIRTEKKTDAAKDDDEESSSNTEEVEEDVEDEEKVLGGETANKLKWVSAGFRTVLVQYYDAYMKPGLKNDGKTAVVNAACRALRADAARSGDLLPSRDLEVCTGWTALLIYIN